MDSTAALLSEVDDAFALALERDQRQPTNVTCTVEGVLLPEDLRQYLDEQGNLRTTAKADEKDIRLLRERHHSVARYLAEGLPQSVISTLTGYTAAYISTLATAPAMIELVEHYRAPGGLATRQISESLRRVAGMSVERLEAKIEQDALTPSELTAVAKLGYDRSGHGPQSTVHNINEHHIIDHAEIEARHREAKRRDAELIVHPEDVRKALPAPARELPDGEQATP